MVAFFLTEKVANRLVVDGSTSSRGDLAITVKIILVVEESLNRILGRPQERGSGGLAERVFEFWVKDEARWMLI